MMTDFKILHILSDSKLEINLKRKLENDPSQISRQSSNEKRQKIEVECQDYDERFNDDCLAEIFMYISIYERPKLALVCKQWNRALHSSWFKVKQVELSHWEYLRHEYIFNRLKKTDRLSLCFLKSLLNNCCRYLTELDLAAYDNSNIVPFVNESCPNLVKLRLRFQFIKNEELKNAFSRMPKLKILKMIFQDSCGIPETVLDSLKDVANTLSELTLAYWSEYITSNYDFPSSFPAIISQLKALQKIEITGLKIDSNLYESIKNAKLNLFVDNYLDNLSCSSFTFLTNLHLINYEVTDDVLYYFVNNIRLLKLIKVLSTYITDVGIRTIAKITRLTSLYLYGANQHITDSSIKLLKNLLVLRLPYSNKITNDSVTEVLKNSPLMNWLTIIHTGVTPEFSKKASEIVSERKKYLILCVSFDKNIFTSRGYKLPFLAIHYHDENTKINKKLHGCSSSDTVDVVYYN